MFGFIRPFIIFGAIFIGGAIFMVYGVVSAIMTFQGKYFRYVILGLYLEKGE